MKYYVNKNILKTKRVFPIQGRYEYHRYDMNENTTGLPQNFVNSVLSEITPEFLSIYPEPDRFIKKYAKYIGANFENIVTTNGSDMAIRYILEVFGEEGKDVVTVSPSFEMYWVNCNILGLRHKPVSYEKDLTLDINKIVEAIDDDTRIVVLVNPNNPIGNVYSEEEMLKILQITKEVNAILVIDEAYHYFYDKTFINYAVKEENVIVLRTFSKLFSLAALRMGVVVAHPNLIEYIKRSRLTFDTNAVALLFAERILDHPQIIQQLIQMEAEGKSYALKRLSALGYTCRECKGNFIFIKTKNDAREIAKRLEEENKILVHAYSNQFLKDFIRVSTGNVENMKFFIDSFLKIDK
ncbi:MAG: histidinol-phosphate aminotransferase family protein [Roseburia sp.]|nr:histidinol-phosphate aminotransferase family protein [Anaeroplasma bactoclasticum]MCM1196277.1 histidinol-phosphate aminotransferase family protein [Roseburia sp.]MCM1557384.1 histidinol-phosphate aminotransferase family protein [Anaeroplasma bactoclasticum]